LNSINKSIEGGSDNKEIVISGLHLINDINQNAPSFAKATDFFNYYLSVLKKLNPNIIKALCYSRAGHLINKSAGKLYLMGASPQQKECVFEDISSAESAIQKLVDMCLERKQHIFSRESACLYICYEGFDSAFYIDSCKSLDQDNQIILETYSTVISKELGNLNLKNKLKRLAHVDWLTRLPNRAEFLKQIVNQKSQHFKQYGIALIDINHFSDINDGLGMDIGSAVLVAVSERLQSRFPSEGQLGRISGDVFGILTNLDDLNLKNLADLFSKPFLIGVHTIPITVSVGVCKLDYRHDGSHYLRCATIALNHAKKSLVESYAFYDSNMDQQTKHKLEMIRHLQNAFEKKELELWYQPQVDLISEKVIGLEALLRWKHSDETYVSPDEFIPLAEYSGLILGIGEWVIVEAALSLSKLQRLGLKDIRIAVNVSVLQFRSTGFVDFICETLDAHSVEPQLFELEITESVVMDDPQIVIKALNELKGRGFNIALDDFGTGFSSLSYLQKLPLDRLKVDKSFVSDLTNPKHRVIAQSIFSLGSQLGLSTIAEGVETRSQASQMLRLGADEAQGFLYSKAIPFNELSSLLLKTVS
jgi:diguanylate cyclase (GGDEF)-like protein